MIGTKLFAAFLTASFVAFTAAAGAERLHEKAIAEQSGKHGAAQTEQSSQGKSESGTTKEALQTKSKGAEQSDSPQDKKSLSAQEKKRLKEEKKAKEKAEREAKKAEREAKKAEKSEKNAKIDEKSGADKLDDEKKMSLSERIAEILNPKQPEKEEKPTAFAYDDIFGKAQATREQCVGFLLAANPNPSINVSAQELVGYYYDEAEKEGIRADVAFVQALKETGFFRYGGTVVPEQNNYCGLGTTSATVKGEYFPSPQIGVRAHVQHLLAYASTRLPAEQIVDPRYMLVRNIYGDRVLTKWQDLNGRWAVPGDGYGESILSIHQKLLEFGK